MTDKTVESAGKEKKRAVSLPSDPKVAKKFFAQLLCPILILVLGCENVASQVEAEVVSNSMNRFHKTTYK